MANSPQLPGSHAWRDASGQPLPVEFFKFFRSLLTFIAETEGATIDLAALTARVDALEAAGVDDIGLVLGAMSVKHYGVLTNGNVTLTLVGDVDSPGNSYGYGTNAAGVKGWHLRDLDSLSDVDLTTVPPTSGDALVFDGGDWVPGAVLSNPMTTIGDIITADTGGVPQRLPVGTNGYVLTVVAGEPDWVAPTGGGGNGAIGATFDGGGAALTPGVFTDVFVPFNCTIVGATLLADTTGNLVVSVLADPYASFPPTTDLAPTTPPTITGSNKSQDTTLSGWSTAITAGDVVRLGVVSCSSITRATLSLEVTKP